MAQPVMAPNAQHISANWGAGQQQQTGAWCFAAATAIVQGAFGTNWTQIEIAHRSLMNLGETGTDANATAYRQGVLAIQTAQGYANTSWALVGAQVQANAQLLGWLNNTWGAPQLDGRTYAGGGRLTEQEMITTIEADGLIIAANTVHYMVINAWRRVNGVVNFRRYNPMNGTNDWVSSDVAREVAAPAANVTTFRVTA